MSLLSAFLVSSLLAQSPAPVAVAPKSKDGTEVEITLALAKGSKLPAGKLTQEAGEALLHLHLVTDGNDGPTMLGAYERRGDSLVFVPRFPLQPDKTYRVHATGPDGKGATVDYKVPARPAAPRADVVMLWPTPDVLPANQLRFHIQFSRPMRGGPDIFKQIQLLDADGNEIFDPWLPDELWSEDDTMLTLLIHPGRIKWGVLLRCLLGPVLEPDRGYTFVIKAEMLDADGRKLAKESRKKFRTSAEDRVRIELSAWKLAAPKAGTAEALTVNFGKTLDHLSAERFLKVVDAKGQPVAGKGESARDGKSWKFTPAAKWTAQDYNVVVDDRLEDTAGNTPRTAFDVDTDAPKPAPQRLTLPFRPQK
jgi:hypothetical protein